MNLAGMTMILLLVCVGCFAAEKADDGWISLFDGKTLDGWKVGGPAESFTVTDGAIVANGKPMAHLFYDGKVKDHEFRNFEFKADVMTTPQANSGIYLHTKFQPGGWPGKGYEAQVNCTHSDPVKTGSLYHVQDVKQCPHKDNEWFTYYIMVNGKHIVIKVNDKTTVDYTEPDDGKGRLSIGTFALQAHDPKSKVLFKNIMVKPLPDEPAK